MYSNRQLIRLRSFACSYWCVWSAKSQNGFLRKIFLKMLDLSKHRHHSSACLRPTWLFPGQDCWTLWRCPRGVRRAGVGPLYSKPRPCWQKARSFPGDPAHVYPSNGTPCLLTPMGTTWRWQLSSWLDSGHLNWSPASFLLNISSKGSTCICPHKCVWVNGTVSAKCSVLWWAYNELWRSSHSPRAVPWYWVLLVL